MERHAQGDGLISAQSGASRAGPSRATPRKCLGQNPGSEPAGEQRARSSSRDLNLIPRSGCSVDTTSRLWAAAACLVRRSDACAARGQSGAGRSHRRGAHRDGREHEPDGGAAQSLRYRYRRACCGPKALPLGLRDREVAAPSLSYREPPSTCSVVVYIGGVATLEKARASLKSENFPRGIGTSCPWPK